MSSSQETSQHYGVVSHADKTVTLFVPRGEQSPKDSDGKYISILEETIEHDIKHASLPLSKSLGPTIGWGARSAAIRLETDKEDYAIVFKPLHDLSRFPVEDDPHLNTTSKQIIYSALKKHMQPSFYVLSEGIAGKPALLKISREVHGFPLSEYHPALLLSDIDAIDTIIHLFSDTIKLAKERGIFIDLWGNITSGTIHKFINMVLPMSLRNVIVQQPFMNMPIIDVSAIPEYTESKHMDVKQKLLRTLQRVSLTSTVHLLKIWKHAVSLRNTLFKGEQYSAESDNSFKYGFSNIIHQLEEHNIEYRVVGSVAIAGLLKEKNVHLALHSKRSNGTKRDVDILCFCSNDQIKKINSEYTLLQQDHSDYPDIHLVSVPNTPPLAISGKVVLPHYDFDHDNNLQKKLGDQTLTYSKKDSEAHLVTLWGVQYKTFSAQITAAQYLIRNGFILPEDLQKIRLLCKTYNCEIPMKFIDFGRNIRKKFPRDYGMLVFRSVLDYWTGGTMLRGVHSIKNSLQKIVSYTSQRA